MPASDYNTLADNGTDIMLKRTLIIGLFLAVSGGALLAWAILQPMGSAEPGIHPPQNNDYEVNSTIALADDWPTLTLDNNEALNSELKQLRSKTPERQNAEKWARFWADIEKLAAGDVPEPDLANALYPPNWQEHVNTYRQRQENREILLIAAAVVAAIGGATVVLSLIVGFFLGLIKLVRGRSQGIEQIEPEESCLPEGAIQDIKLDFPPPPAECPTDPLSQRDTVATDPSKAPARSVLRVDFPADKPESETHDVANYHRVYPAYDDEVDTSCSRSKWHVQDMLVDKQDESLAVNEKPILPSPTTGKAEKEEVTPRAVVVSPETHSTADPDRQEEASTVAVSDDSAIAVQTSELEQQIAQMTEMAQSTEATEPMNQTLQALSEQITAIRQYASSQQDRVEKLQSGYDWNIIRTFCVRVIRCIDNLEMRMDRCADETLVQELSEVHDELLFSLESSGIEQFAPEINSPFCGQERLAEAVKEKVACTQPELKGCIAQVVKPGYQYVIDEENVKIVRTARVKLYGES